MPTDVTSPVKLPKAGAASLRINVVAEPFTAAVPIVAVGLAPLGVALNKANPPAAPAVLPSAVATPVPGVKKANEPSVPPTPAFNVTEPSVKVPVPVVIV